MNNTDRIIQKFGGQSALASLIGKRQSTVQYWSRSGSIPAKWHSVLIDLGHKKSLDLSASDFLQKEELVIGEISVPKATHWGNLPIGAAELPCYVLEGGIRVFSLKGAVVGLIGTEGGQLAEYIKVKSLRPFLPEDMVPDDTGAIPALIKFDTGGEGFTKYAIGVPVEKFMDVCAAYSTALQEDGRGVIHLTEKQRRIAEKSNMFLRASAKTGIIALVDEVTGYQYDRAEDALRLKLNLFLAEEMRKWEKTFPDQLWAEFGRLTKWKGAAHQRPKYWGKLVNELIYGYLDADVMKWLKDNAPNPVHGKNYHQWLSSQYGLKKLIEHLWMVVGMASACQSMFELRRKMAEKYGRVSIQLTLFLPSDN